MRQEAARVLIVDDDFLVIQMIRSTLRKMGYTVVGEAETGRLGVEMTEALQPDVVIMDIEMPDMGGIEATRLITETCPTPVVVLTAYESSELVAQVSEAGAGAYLLKPPKARELGRAITIAMARFDDMMELRRLNEELREALATIKTLDGLIPICAWCHKNIRDEGEHWIQLEEYITERSNATFTHSICPDCLRKFKDEI